jgi:hypothetical protein
LASILIRFATPADRGRFIVDGLITGNPPAGTTWQERVVQWFTDVQHGRRAIIVAEDNRRLIGCIHVVFKFPEGVNDPEVADGKEVALVEHLRFSAKVPPKVVEQLALQLEREAESVARRRSVKKLTYMVPMESNTLVNQAKAWGYQEFRVMMDGGRTLAFFRKHLA